MIQIKNEHNLLKHSVRADIIAMVRSNENQERRDKAYNRYQHLKDWQVWKIHVHMGHHTGMIIR